MKITELAINRKLTGGGSGGGGGEASKTVDAFIDGSITEIKSNATTTRNYALYGCANLRVADFSSLQSIQGQALGNCGSLIALILRADAICTLDYGPAMSLSGCIHLISKKDGYVYVPRAWLSNEDESKDYRRATNWSAISTQFRVLEDYTVDGTITGEFDWEKVNAA